MTHATPHRGASQELQDRLLPGVSRTFALTIPELPSGLRRAVTNAYLLCRIADTIEDDIALEPADKQRWHDEFVAIVGGQGDAVAFSRRLAPLLSDQTPAQERELVRQTPRVVDVTLELRPAQRHALERCVRIMCSGMPEFQQHRSLAGLATVGELQRYCYFVAGVVGEMLTELFCDHAEDIATQRDRLLPLAVAFGQGLQLTNILKDCWEDRADGSCWLPRDVFRRHGIDLAALEGPVGDDPAYTGALRELLAIAHGSLRQAMQYVYLIPARETGIRRFCLWAIGLAVLTLQNIRRQPAYRSGQDVKVSRRAVRGVVVTANLAGRVDSLLALAFEVASLGLPDPGIALDAPPGEARVLSDRAP